MKGRPFSEITGSDFAITTVYCGLVVGVPLLATLTVWFEPRTITSLWIPCAVLAHGWFRGPFELSCRSEKFFVRVVGFRYLPVLKRLIRFEVPVRNCIISTTSSTNGGLVLNIGEVGSRSKVRIRVEADRAWEMVALLAMAHANPESRHQMASD